MLQQLLSETSEHQYARQFERYETYIPYKPNTICQLIVERFSKEQSLYPATEEIGILHELNRRLTSVVKLQTVDNFDKWQDSYLNNDPDSDVLITPEEIINNQYVSESIALFQKHLVKALKSGSFERLTVVNLKEAAKAKSVAGLGVVIPDDSEVNFVMFGRGRRSRETTFRSPNTLWLIQHSQEVKIYQRVFLVFDCSEGINDDSRPICSFGWLLDWITGYQHSLSKSLKPGKLYLRIFKDIAASDIDMLIPGSRVEFTRLDYMLLFIPMLIGIIAAICKAIMNTLTFDNLTHTITSITLVILPLAYAVRAYFGFRQKQQMYMAKLTDILFLHTLAANSGAITALLEEVSDQVTTQVLLAYAFLWKGLSNPVPVLQDGLRSDIEQFLNDLTRESSLQTTIRYDVQSVCDQLEKLNLLKKIEVINEETWVQAVTPESAIEALSSIDLTQSQRSLSIAQDT